MILHSWVNPHSCRIDAHVVLHAVTQVGLQMNYNKLCACVAEDAIHPNFEHSLGQVRRSMRPSFCSPCACGRLQSPLRHFLTGATRHAALTQCNTKHLLLHSVMADPFPVLIIGLSKTPFCIGSAAGSRC